MRPAATWYLTFSISVKKRLTRYSTIVLFLEARADEVHVPLVYVLCPTAVRWFAEKSQAEVSA